MKQLTTLFLIVSCHLTVIGQVTNDNCTNAIIIDIPVPAGCSFSQQVSIGVDGTTFGATPSSPVLRLADESRSSTLQVPVADVWYAFTATANRLDITLTSDELEQPSLLLFQASSCGDKWPVALKRESANSVTLSANVEPGQLYYVLVGGKDTNTQGEFNLQLKTYDDCSTCGKRRGLISATPAPVNGRYEAGQTVTFCYTPTLWDPGYALEWLHAVELDFGPGWDLGTLQTSAPLPCTADMGEWGYYDSWQSCNTGATFGPGFAFDARQGLLCGSATPMDGEPGNNFGDGPCDGLEAAPLPLTFCWTIQVRDDFSTEQDRALDLSVRPLGDGYSGSWMPFDCEGEVSSQFLATAVPTTLTLPDISILERPCPNSCNGLLYLEGGDAQAYRLFDATGALLYETNASSLNDTLSNLCAGEYELIIQTSNTEQGIPLAVPERQLPEGQVGYIAPCNDQDDFQLIGLLSDPSAPASFFWEGPNGFTAVQANPNTNVEGNYTLHIEVGGCDLIPLNLDVEHRLPVVQATPTSSSVIFGWSASPQDTAYEVTVLSGQSGSFTAERSFLVNGLDEGETVEIELNALGTGNCAERTVRASSTSLSCALLPVTPDTIICQGQPFELSIESPDDAVVSWSPADSVACSTCATTLAEPQESTVYEVEVIHANGCVVRQSVQVWVDELPDSILPDTTLTFCPGEPFEFCLPGEYSYLWISPIGFIKTGRCLTYPNTNERVAGEYLIRVQRPDGCRFFERLELEVGPDCDDNNLITDPLPSTMGGQAVPTQANVFPNPAQHQFQLQTQGETIELLLLYNSTGQILEQWLTAGPGEQYDVHGLAAGMYYLEVAFENGQTERHRIVVKR